MTYLDMLRSGMDTLDIARERGVGEHEVAKVIHIQRCRELGVKPRFGMTPRSRSDIRKLARGVTSALCIPGHRPRKDGGLPGPFAESTQIPPSVSYETA